METELEAKPVALEPVVGHCYLCRDGLRRWVVMKHRPGNGYSLTWDTADPREKDYWGNNGLRERELAGKAGNMQWQKFIRQVLEDVTPNAKLSRVAAAEKT